MGFKAKESRFYEDLNDTFTEIFSKHFTKQRRSIQGCQRNNELEVHDVGSRNLIDKEKLKSNESSLITKEYTYSHREKAEHCTVEEENQLDAPNKMAIPPSKKE